MPPPILRHKAHSAPSVFQPQNLIRDARTQKGLDAAEVPPLCVLDPDGDIVRHLVRIGDGARSTTWACYHSQMYLIERAGIPIGIVDCAVGAPYAVLIAEQAFASGAKLLVSITSSGQLATLGETPYFVLVERALRDEGTSYHYLPADEFAEADPAHIDAAAVALDGAGLQIHRGATWTTDAPFRETETVLAKGRTMGLAAIEMECAALYAFAQARGRPVICLAHVTNTMAVNEGDFEKGAHGGAEDALLLIERLAALAI